MSGPSQGGIFISYRRQDSADWARWLSERLDARFPGQVFRDVDSIGHGVAFDEAIAQAVSTCQVLLVVIGPKWLTATNAEGQRRLDDPEDVVRLEIEAAFRGGVRVIPILVEGAMTPRQDELPESLGGLARVNALVLHPDRMNDDVSSLLTAQLEHLLQRSSLSADTPKPPAPAERSHSKPERRRIGEAIRYFWDEFSKGVNDASGPSQPVSGQIGPDPLEPSTLSVFLCHSSSDKPAVRSLHAQLLRDGISPWLDEADILPGQDWDSEIRRAIRNCHIVLVCLSKDSINRVGYIQKEIRQVLDVADEQPDGTIFLIPVRLEECEVPDRLRRWQWVDLFKEGGYGRLMLALAARRSDLSKRGV
jgi:hypothetical protein